MDDRDCVTQHGTANLKRWPKFSFRRGPRSTCLAPEGSPPWSRLQAGPHLHRRNPDTGGSDVRARSFEGREATDEGDDCEGDDDLAVERRTTRSRRRSH